MCSEWFENWTVIGDFALNTVTESRNPNIVNYSLDSFKVIPSQADLPVTTGFPDASMCQSTQNQRLYGHNVIAMRKVDEACNCAKTPVSIIIFCTNNTAVSALPAGIVKYRYWVFLRKCRRIAFWVNVIKNHKIRTVIQDFTSPLRSVQTNLVDYKTIVCKKSIVSPTFTMAFLWAT